MFYRAAGRGLAWLRLATARGLVRLGVRPNSLTVFGCVATVGAGAAIALGRGRIGGLLLILACAGDILDGAVARLGNRKTAFGAFLDSSLDRVSDLGIFAGLAVHFAFLGNLTYVLLSVLALGAAEIISYTRARAECLIPSCKVGYWERPERIVLLLAGLLFRRELLMLWIAATAPWFTVLHRLLHGRRLMEGMAPPGAEQAAAPGGPPAAQPRPPRRNIFTHLFLWCPARGSLAYELLAVVVLTTVILLPVPLTDPLRALATGTTAGP